MAVGALAQPDVGAVSAILIAAMPTAQHLDILVVVGRRQVGAADHYLPIPAREA